MNTFRGSVCLVLIAGCALAALPRTDAAQAAGGTRFQVVLSGTVTAIGGDCCFLTADFSGNGVVPMLGPVTVTGSFVYLGTPGQTQPCELVFGVTPCEQRIFVQLIAASGRQLTIRGDDFWTPPAPAPAVWSWSATSGDLVGSGTYSTTLIGGSVTGEIGQQLTITLSGTLAPSARPTPRSADAPTSPDPEVAALVHARGATAS